MAIQTPSAALIGGYLTGENGWGDGVNQNWLTLEILSVPFVNSASISAPPSSPAVGDRYLIASGASGLWAGKSGQIALWFESGWRFFSPAKGWYVRALDVERSMLYDGSAWSVYYDAIDSATMTAINTAIATGATVATQAAQVAADKSAVSADKTLAQTARNDAQAAATTATGSATTAATSAGVAVAARNEAAVFRDEAAASAQTASYAAATANSASVSAENSATSATASASLATTKAADAAASAASAGSAAAVVTGLAANDGTTKVNGTWFGSVVALVSDLAVAATNKGAALISFLQSGTGAQASSVQDELKTRVNALQFMTPAQRVSVTSFAGNVDVTAALQAALDHAYLVGKELWLPAGVYLISSQVRNKGVCMRGEGRFASQLKVATSFPAATAILLIQPDSGAYIEFLELARFSIQPNNGGTKHGGNCIFMNFQQPTNLSKLHMHDLYLFSGNDYSLRIDNAIGVNVQGVPAASVIENNVFAEGTKMVGIGDSNSIRNNIFQASGGSRCGIHLYHVDGGGGISSHTVIRENNANCVGGFVYAIRGRNIKVIDNNVELSAGAGTPNGAVIDIDGGAGTIPWSTIDDNHIGIFGTATPTSAIRINGSSGARIAHNTILTGITVAKAIDVTASATDTQIGDMNEISSTFTTAISNAGGSTRGDPIALTPINGWANRGSGYQTLSAYKGGDGLVTIGGVVTAPATPNGIVIAVLPTGFRPSAIQRVAVSAVVSGGVSTQAIEVGSSGNIVYYGSNSATQVEIGITFSTKNHVVGGL